MRKFNLLKLFFVCILLFTPISCNQHKTDNQTTNIEIISDTIDTIDIDTCQVITYGARMYNAFEKEFSKQQFDSICRADRISNDLKTWHVLTTKEGDTNEVITEYMYIKYQNNVEYIYRLIKINDNTYKITKRIKNN